MSALSQLDGAGRTRRTSPRTTSRPDLKAVAAASNGGDHLQQLAVALLEVAARMLFCPKLTPWTIACPGYMLLAEIASPIGATSSRTAKPSGTLPDMRSSVPQPMSTGQAI